jgi:hypothetical protein
MKNERNNVKRNLMYNLFDNARTAKSRGYSRETAWEGTTWKGNMNEADIAEMLVMVEYGCTNT